MLPPPGRACHLIDRTTDEGGNNGVTLNLDWSLDPINMESYSPSSLKQTNHAKPPSCMSDYTVYPQKDHTTPHITHNTKPSPKLPLLPQTQCKPIYITWSHTHVLPTLTQKTHADQSLPQQIPTSDPQIITTITRIPDPPTHRTLPHLQTHRQII